MSMRTVPLSIGWTDAVRIQVWPSSLCCSAAGSTARMEPGWSRPAAFITCAVDLDVADGGRGSEQEKQQQRGFDHSDPTGGGAAEPVHVRLLQRLLGARPQLALERLAVLDAAAPVEARERGAASSHLHLEVGPMRF